MIFRDYNPADYADLIAFWEELDLTGPERDDTPGIILQTLEMGGKLILMTNPDDDTIVGSSWMTFDGRRIFMHHYGIKKDHQNRGLGTLLAKESLKFIKDKGYQVKLEVHKGNIAAKTMYENEGFFAFTDYDIYMIRDLEKI